MNELEWLFDTLWTKNAEPTRYSFSVPHTVVFRKSEPCRWYFAVQDTDGFFRILQKDKANVTSARVQEQILSTPAKAKPTDFCVAQSYFQTATALYVKFLTQTDDFSQH